MGAVREKKIDLFVALGASEATFMTALENGFVLGAEVHTNHTDIDNLAEIGIFDDSGVALSKPTHVNHWKRREGAGFHESYKPLMFETESKTYNFKVTLKSATAKATYFQIILMYKIQTPNCPNVK